MSRSEISYLKDLPHTGFSWFYKNSQDPDPQIPDDDCYLPYTKFEAYFYIYSVNPGIYNDSVYVQVLNSDKNDNSLELYAPVTLKYCNKPLHSDFNVLPNQSNKVKIVPVPKVTRHNRSKDRVRSALNQQQESIKQILDKQSNHMWGGEDSFYTMPGKGDQVFPDCGQVQFVPMTEERYAKSVLCPNYIKKMSASEWFLGMGKNNAHIDAFKHEKNKHYHHLRRHHCYNRNCPICFKAWAKRQGDAATRIMLAKFDALVEHGFTIKIPKTKILKKNRLHWTFKYVMVDIPLNKLDVYYLSPPQEWAIELNKTKEGAQKLYQEAYKILKMVDCVGGSLVLHDRRQKDPHEDNYQELCEKIPDCPDYDWYQAPHFHIIGAGFIKDIEKMHKKTGWVIHKDRWEKETWQSNAERAISYTLGYNVGHCAIPKEGLYQVVRYFGVFGNRKFKKTMIKDNEVMKCKCGAPLHEYATPYIKISTIEKIDEIFDFDDSRELRLYRPYRKIPTYKYRNSGRYEQLIVSW